MQGIKWTMQYLADQARLNISCMVAANNDRGPIGNFQVAVDCNHDAIYSVIQ